MTGDPVAVALKGCLGLPEPLFVVGRSINGVGFALAEMVGWREGWRGNRNSSFQETVSCKLSL